MSRLAFGVAAAVTVFIAAGFVTLAYPFIYRQPLAESFLEVDGAEGKAWLDTRIVIEIRGSLSEDQVRESLGIYPPVRLGEEDLKVEHIAKLPWHERFPWAKTRVSINPHKARLFEPETGYTVVLNDKRLTFETITLPRVVDARVDSILHHNFMYVAPSNPIVLAFNEEVVWRDEYLELEPPVEVTTASNRSADGGTEVWVIPEGPWVDSTTYTLTISEGVKDIFGHEGVERFSLDFTIRPRPQIIAASLAGDRLPTDPVVRLRFERPVDRESVEEAFEVQPDVAGSVRWESDLVLTWTPDNNVDYSTTYTVTAGGTSIDGDLFVPNEWAFTTPDPPVYVTIEGSDESPTLLRAVVSGGTGDYSYEWSSGEPSEEISVDLWYGETRTFEVTVTSGDQQASAQLLVLGPPPPCPEGWRIITEEVCYKEEVLPGPVRVFVTRVDVQDPDVQLDAAPAADFLGIPSTVSRSARARDTLVSINSDFFNLARGEYFTRGPIVSGSNFVYTPRPAGVVFALDPDLNSWVGPAEEFAVYVNPTSGETKRLETINSPPGGDGLALFNAYWGERLSLGLDGCFALFAPTDPAMNVAYRFSCGAIEDIPLAAGEFVLIARGESTEWMKQNIERPISFSTSSPLSAVDFMVGGSHVLLQNGEPSDGTSFASGRHPRTAIGIDEQSFVYVVVVDGRSEASIGMSLAELRNYLGGLGLVSAINLDGGGSSTMVLQGSVVNTPSDGRERSVAGVVEIAEQHPTCWHEFVRC